MLKRKYSFHQVARFSSFWDIVVTTDGYTPESVATARSVAISLRAWLYPWERGNTPKQVATTLRVATPQRVWLQPCKYGYNHASVATTLCTWLQLWEDDCIHPWECGYNPVLQLWEDGCIHPWECGYTRESKARTQSSLLSKEQKVNCNLGTTSLICY